MAPSDEAHQLLAAACNDWRALGGMGDTTIFTDTIFGFHAQQAVEKALKAWLALLGVEYPRTHDLSLLLGILRDSGQNVESLSDLINSTLMLFSTVTKHSRKLDTLWIETT